MRVRIRRNKCIIVCLRKRKKKAKCSHQRVYHTLPSIFPFMEQNIIVVVILFAYSGERARVLSHSYMEIARKSRALTTKPSLKVYQSQTRERIPYSISRSSVYGILFFCPRITC